MKVLSLWEPWASAMAISAKRVETRDDWVDRIKYRGLVWIHATMKPEFKPVEYPPEFLEWVERVGIDWRHLPYGHMLAVGKLVKIVKTESIRDTLSEQELAFGDYRDNRRGLIFKNVRRLREPIKVSGKQGLWNWDPPPDWEDLLIASDTSPRTIVPIDKPVVGATVVKPYASDPADVLFNELLGATVREWGERLRIDVDYEGDECHVTAHYNGLQVSYTAVRVSDEYAIMPSNAASALWSITSICWGRRNLHDFSALVFGYEDKRKGILRVDPDDPEARAKFEEYRRIARQCLTVFGDDFGNDAKLLQRARQQVEALGTVELERVHD